MAHLSNLNSVSDTIQIHLTEKLPKTRSCRRNSEITGFLSKKPDEAPQLQSTRRRLALSIASSIAALIGSSSNGVSLAEDNGFFYIGPLPVPSVDNKLENEKTGTRSFLLKRLYMADIGAEGSANRIRKYAFDLLAMEDLIGEDTLNYVKKYLKQKATFMYYDFDKVITAASVDNKVPLLNLANRLFDSFEKLEDATKIKSLSQTESCYGETKLILQEVMDRMA